MKGQKRKKEISTSGITGHVVLQKTPLGGFSCIFYPRSRFGISRRHFYPIPLGQNQKEGYRKIARFLRKTVRDNPSFADRII